MALKPYNCTIRVFDPADGRVLAEHVLPVDSPDAEHAAASTLANAASFTPKTMEDGGVRSVAFACVHIAPRTV